MATLLSNGYKMDDDFSKLDNWLEPLVKNLSSSERRKLNRSLATGLRRRQAQRIAAQQNPDGTHYEKRRPAKKDKSGRIRKRKKMFQNLRKVRHLKISSDSNHAAVGFKGKASRIARVHQEGLVDRVSQGGPLFKYPMRRLLGFSQDDRDWVFQQVINQINL